MIGDKAVVIQLLPRFRIDHRHLEPLHRQGIVTTAQEHVIDVPILGHFGVAAIPVVAFQLGQAVVGLPKGQALVEFGMGIGLAYKDEIVLVLQHQLTKRLIAVEIIAE